MEVTHFSKSTSACFGIFIMVFGCITLTIFWWERQRRVTEGKSEWVSERERETKRKNYVCEFICMMNQVSRLCNYSAFELLLPLHWVFEFAALKNCVFGAGCLDEWQTKKNIKKKRRKFLHISLLSFLRVCLHCSNNKRWCWRKKEKINQNCYLAAGCVGSGSVIIYWVRQVLLL